MDKHKKNEKMFLRHNVNSQLEEESYRQCDDIVSNRNHQDHFDDDEADHIPILLYKGTKKDYYGADRSYVNYKGSVISHQGNLKTKS